jgi:hypothetical protein
MFYILVVMIYTGAHLQRVEMSTPISGAACHQMENDLRGAHRNYQELYKQHGAGARMEVARTTQPKIFCQPLGGK